jgi:hypothetical protein
LSHIRLVAVRACQFVHPGLFTRKNRQLSPRPNRYKLENTTELITELKNAPTLPQFALASLDITNLCTNNPVAETREVIASALEDKLLDS